MRSTERVSAFVNTILAIWDVRDQGEPSDFLDIQIVRHSTTSISLRQAPCITQTCELFGIQSMHPRALRMDRALQFIKEMVPPAAKSEQYCKLVGALIRTNCTGPDISLFSWRFG